MAMNHCMLINHYSNVCADEIEIGKGKLEGDTLLVEGDKPYEYRKRRMSDMGNLTCCSQEVNMTGMTSGDNADYTHIWPNRTVHYTFAPLIGEQLATC